MIDLVDGNVVVKEVFMKKGSLIKEFYDSDHSTGHKSFHQAMRYIYFMYHKDSEFRDIPLEDRKKIISKDFIGQEDYHEKIEKLEHVKKLISLLEVMQFTKNEQALEAARLKIDEFGVLLRETTLDLKNQNDVKHLIQNYEDLLKLKERLENLVFKDQQQNVGGGESKMFED